MNKRRRKVKYENNNVSNYLPVILLISWVILLVFLSSQGRDASKVTSVGFIQTVFFWKDHDFALSINNVFRDYTHIAVFFVMGMLILATSKIYKNKNNAKNIFFSLILSLCLAITDETYQYFFSKRIFEIKDIVFDCLGALLGVLLISIIHSIINKKSKNADIKLRRSQYKLSSF